MADDVMKFWACGAHRPQVAGVVCGICHESEVEKLRAKLAAARADRAKDAAALVTLAAACEPSTTVAPSLALGIIEMKLEQQRVRILDLEVDIADRDAEIARLTATAAGYTRIKVEETTTTFPPTRSGS